MCKGLGFTSTTTTNTALVGYLFSSFSSILDFNLEAPGSIPSWCVAFISTFPLFPTINESICTYYTVLQPYLNT